MDFAGSSAPAASWPATIAARRAQRTRALAALGAGAALVVVALGIVAVVVASGGLDEPAGAEASIAVIGGAWGAVIAWYGVQLLRRWQRPQAVLDVAPWTVTTGSAVSSHLTRRRRSAYFVGVVLPETGAVHVLSAIDGARTCARLHGEEARPLWIARRGEAWVVSPAGGETPIHAHPVTRAEREAVGSWAVKDVREKARADGAAASGEAPFGRT